MTALEAIIKDKIRERGEGGYLRIDEYMALCLGHPEHGYYMTRDPFGAEGDFTTAPEISQMFGELIGAWLADSWMKMGAPDKITLLECGPGRGTLMADILRATSRVAGFHQAINLHLLESSPMLRKAQETGLKGHDATWHADTESIPADSPLMVIGNEFLDALPVRQFVCSDPQEQDSWQEKVVKLDINDTLRIDKISTDKGDIGTLQPFLIPPAKGDQVEVSLEQKRILEQFMNIMEKQGGIALFVDYGFVHSVSGDTLQAVTKHSYTDILESPGEVDITAHVNFAEISRFAMEKNMTVHGPVSQGDFLNRLGLELRAQKLHQSATEEQRRNIDAAVKRLSGKKTKENEMGDLFKVIAFSSNPEIELAGFA